MEDKFYRAITHQGYKSEKVAQGLKNSFHHRKPGIIQDSYYKAITHEDKKFEENFYLLQ